MTLAEDAPVVDLDGTALPVDDEAAPKWWYWGGPKKEHSTKPQVVVSPYSVTQGYRWCARAVLPATEASLLLALFVRVDAKTWRWPPKPGEGGGSSIYELSQAIDKCERTTQRTLRKLEARGVLITFDCRPARNEYQIVPEKLKELGEAGQQVVRQAVQERRRFKAEQQAAADAKLDSGDSASPGVDPLPRWARRVSKKDGMTPDLAASLVRSVWRAAGEQGLWLHEGCNVRRIIKTWRGLGEPSLEEWDTLMQGIARAVTEGRLRGLMGRGWRWSTRAVLKLSEHASAREVVRLMHKPAVAPAESNEDSPGDGGGAEAGALLLPGPASPTGPPVDAEAWGRHFNLLRSRSGAMADIWLTMVSYRGVDDLGVTELEVQHPMAAERIGEHFGDALALISNGPVRLVWGR